MGGASHCATFFECPPAGRQADRTSVHADIHPELLFISDKITGRAMSWWGHGGTLYLGVKTLTNLPLRLRSAERSKCTRVCQRCNQRVDLGPWQWLWHNYCRIIMCSINVQSSILCYIHLWSLACGAHFLKIQFFLLGNTALCWQYQQKTSATISITQKCFIVTIDLVKCYCTSCTPSQTSLSISQTLIPVNLLLCSQKVGQHIQ